MQFLQTVCTLLVFAGLIFWFWKLAADIPELKPFFIPALALKLFCGFAIGYFYGPSFDTHLYQKVASDMTRVAFSEPAMYLKIFFRNQLPGADIFPAPYFQTYSNSFFQSKIISLLNFLTGSNYYLNSLFFSFFAFAGLWYFVRTVSLLYPSCRTAAVISFLFFPSVVLWSSGILKESILVGSLCLFWASALKMTSISPKKLLPEILLLLLSAWLLWKIKYFVAVLVYGLTATWLGLKYLKQRFAFFRNPYRLALIVPVFVSLLAIGLSFLHEQFNSDFFLHRLVWNYEEMLRLSPGRPVLVFNSLQPSFSSVLANIPRAVWGVLFRPFVWEGTGTLYLLAGVENAFLLILAAGGVLPIKALLKKDWPGFYAVLLVYCLVLAATFAMATPNLGSLSRYRVAFLPFLIFILLQTPFWQRLSDRWRRV